jgi:hypothetical protein
MAFQVGASRQQLSGPPPVPNNIYTLQVAGFKPRLSKAQDSLNYNAEFTVINEPAFENRKIFASLNTKFFQAIRDFVHATGNQCEVATVTNPETAQIEEIFVLPGVFENADANPQNPELWGAYRGPLTNATFKAEVVTTEYQGKKKNEIRCYFCTVQGCAELEPDLKHSTSLIKS